MLAGARLLKGYAGLVGYIDGVPLLYRHWKYDRRGTEPQTFLSKSYLSLLKTRILLA